MLSFGVVELTVTNAEPAVKGDTVTSTNKIVTCETGLEVNVPMFIEWKYNTTGICTELVSAMSTSVISVPLHSF